MELGIWNGFKGSLHKTQSKHAKSQGGQPAGQESLDHRLKLLGFVWLKKHLGLL